MEGKALVVAGNNTVSVRVPVRIDFAGGWTDVHHFSEHEGGAVLNAAIDRFIEGRAVWTGDSVHVEYGMRLPSGSGLGTSDALDVAWLALTNAIIGREQSGVELAEGAYRLEKLLGVEGGKQDQYAAALGGFNRLTFTHENEPAMVESLQIDAAILQSLVERCILCYSGSGHQSGVVHSLVWDAYRSGNLETVEALRRIRDSVGPASEALVSGDFARLAEIVTLNRELARKLHPGLVTPRMEELFTAAAASGALGSKACGAGGGGCLIFLVADGRRSAVEATLRQHGGELIPFRFHNAPPVIMNIA